MSAAAAGEVGATHGRVSEIVAATGNPHKLKEFREVLGELGIRVRSLADVGDSGAEPIESGATFEENAAIKARGYAVRTGLPVLADDSGLEVDHLDGEPGVHSAYWAGLDGTRAERDARNNLKLLGALAGIPIESRSARFVCVLCLAQPSGEIVAQVRGEFEGVIAESPRGEHGFGYDPLFMVPALGATSAELPPERKNEISHRGRALRQLVDELQRRHATER